MVTTINFETEVTDLVGHRQEFTIPVSLSSRDARVLDTCRNKNKNNKKTQEAVEKASNSAAVMNKMVLQAQSTILDSQPWVCCVCGQSNASRFLCVPGHAGTTVVGFAPLVICDDPWCQENAKGVMKRILCKALQEVPDWTDFWNLLIGQQLQEQA